MGHARRMFLHNKPYFVTNRLSTGLPFVPNDYINRILFGILARAQEKVPSISICAWTFLGNHYHGVLIPTKDPNDIQKFMHYLDSETSKAVKKLLGIKHNCSLWSQRYHPALLVTPDAVIKQLAYLFANPVKANLVAQASDWFGVTTFTNDFLPYSREYKWLRSSKLFALPNATFTDLTVKSLSFQFDSECPTHSLRIDPLAWFDCFPGETFSREEIIQCIQDAIGEIQDEAARERLRLKQSLPSKKKLQLQNPHKVYLPSKFGRRVFCISTCPELRKEFIQLYRDFCEQCVTTWKAWKKGFTGAPYPPGAFLPPRRPPANLHPLLI